MTGRLLILAICGALVAAVVATGSEGNPDAGGSAQQPIVGEVVAVSGKEVRLQVAPGGGKNRQPLSEGEKLRLGDVIVPGEGVNATIEVKIPNRESRDEELIFVRDAGSHPIITLKRKRDGVTTRVKIES